MKLVRVIEYEADTKEAIMGHLTGTLFAHARVPIVTVTNLLPAFSMDRPLERPGRNEVPVEQEPVRLRLLEERWE